MILGLLRWEPTGADETRHPAPRLRRPDDRRTSDINLRWALGSFLAGSARKDDTVLVSELSQKERRGLTFFVQGQSIPGIVTKILGEEAVEVRNQTFGRLIIRIDRIDALGLN